VSLPALARRARSGAYWRAQRALRMVLGSRIEERHYRRRSREDVRQWFSNVESPHRPWLASRILQSHPHSILEVGCGFGPNLEILHRTDPTLALTGVDIAPASIAEGRERLGSLGIQGIDLVEGSADELRAFADGAFDVVFTDAALLYVGPDKIGQVLRELARVARGHLLLLEMTDRSSSGDQYTRDGWLRDYRRALGEAGVQGEIAVERLPADVRTDGRWPEYGILVQVTLAGRA